MRRRFCHGINTKIQFDFKFSCKEKQISDVYFFMHEMNNEKGDEKMKLGAWLCLLMIPVLLCGCDTGVGTESVSEPIPAVPLSERMQMTDDVWVPFSEAGAVLISLSDDGVQTDSAAVIVDGSHITITQGGSYILSGTLTDGSVTVSCGKAQTVSMLLRDAHITSSTDAALYIESADAVRLYTDAGTENTLASSYDFSLNTESNTDAALFSKDDLYLSGDGTLTVMSAYGHGVVSKDDLTVVSGSYDIKSASHGISGKDSVTVYDGAFSLDCGKDGIHAENNDDTTLGNLYLLNGSYDITAVGDGLSASAVLQIDGGAYNLTTGGGAENGRQHTDEMFGGNRRGQTFGGWGTDTGNQPQTDDGTTVDSAKGIKAGEALFMTDGTFVIDAADDALHTNGDMTVSGGTLTLSSGDDGLHADNTLSVSGGEIIVSQSYEGLEGTTVLLSGGHVTVNADDDGINAAGGSDGSGFLGFGGGKDIFSSDGVSAVNISGGYLYLVAGGDGLDSNGTLTISGGEVYVDGPTDGANSAVDCAGGAVVTGGTLVAVGSAQMAEGFSEESTQCAALVTLPQTQNASALALYDAGGNLQLSHNPSKAYSAVYISCPAMAVGETYTLVTGDLETEIVMETVVIGSSGFGMGGFGGPGGFGGEMGGNKGNRGDRGDMGQMPGGNRGEMPGMETDEAGNPVVPEMPDGGFGFGGAMPGGMTPPAMPEGAFNGMTPPDGRH